MSAPVRRETLLDVHDVAVHYGSLAAVHDVELFVLAGQVVAIVGPNGAGKTSLLSAIVRLTPLARGVIRLNGRDMAPLRVSDVARLGVALAPEGRNIFTSLSVIENLRLGATVRRDDEVEADIEAAFVDFPILGERRGQPAGLLSGGEQQMLAIARALMSRPSLVLLDEPSLGLAPMTVDKVYEALQKIRARGVALIIAEQNAARAFAIADRAYIMRQGRFTLSGAPEDIAADADFDGAYFGVAMSEEPQP